MNDVQLHSVLVAIASAEARETECKVSSKLQPPLQQNAVVHMLY